MRVSRRALLLGATVAPIMAFLASRRATLRVEAETELPPAPAAPAPAAAAPPLDELSLGGQPRALLLTPDGRQAYAAVTAPLSGGCPCGETPAACPCRAFAAGPPSVLTLTVNGAGATVAGKTEVGFLPSSLALSPDGRYLFVCESRLAAQANAGLSVIDTSTRQVVAHQVFTPSPRFNPREVSVSRDGRSVLLDGLAGGSMTLPLADVVQGTSQPNYAQPAAAAPAVAGPNTAASRTAAVASGQSIIVADPATSARSAPVPVQRHLTQAAVTPDGRYVFALSPATNECVAVNADRALQVGNAAAPLLTAIPVGRYPGAIAVAPNGGTVYVANLMSDAISVIDVASLRVRATLPVGPVPNTIAVSPDGRHLFVGSLRSGALQIIAT